MHSIGNIINTNIWAGYCIYKKKYTSKYLYYSILINTTQRHIPSFQQTTELNRHQWCIRKCISRQVRIIVVWWTCDFNTFLCACYTTTSFSKHLYCVRTLCEEQCLLVRHCKARLERGLMFEMRCSFSSLKSFEKAITRLQTVNSLCYSDLYYESIYTLIVHIGSVVQVLQLLSFTVEYRNIHTFS